jgi:phosphatidylglycerophosphate synthase
MVAVEGGMRTATGELYNEVPDRVSDVAVLVGAGYAVTSGMPALGYLAAIGAVLVAYARALGKGSGHAADFRGPMAKQQRMFIITVICVLLAAAPLPLRNVLTLRLPVWDAPLPLMSIALLVIVAGCVLTFWRRVRLLARRLLGGSPA